LKAPSVARRQLDSDALIRHGIDFAHLLAAGDGARWPAIEPRKQRGRAP
jgi:hypothetical protein